MKSTDLIKKEEFNNIIEDIVSNETVLRMKEFRQHCDVSCFEHCYNAAYYSYVICKKFNLDYKSATRAAMLHDLFLYDWRVKNGRKGFHAFTHPRVACDNACKIFALNELEKGIIVSHMWPLTIKDTPKSKEGLILTFVDKYSATKESFDYFVKNIKSNEILKYAYVVFGFLILTAHKWGRVVIVSIIRSSMF